MASKICTICKTTGAGAPMLNIRNFYICGNCVEQMHHFLAEINEKFKTEPMEETHANTGEAKTGAKDLPTPQMIKDHLDDYIIGQDKAKKILSVAVYNHYKRVLSGNGSVLNKSNILLCGPTGSGKTYLARTLAKIMDVPFVIADATSLTEAGYVGDDVESILAKLINAADGNIERAQKGIVYIDEIDKTARGTENMSITRDVSGEGVQQALLKIIEGSEVSVPPNGGRKHPYQECLTIDTSNILFICAGAFAKMEGVLKKDKKAGKSIGFGSLQTETEPEKKEKPVYKQSDFIKYGLIPEFVGRLPVIAQLEELDEDALVQIMKTPKDNLVKEYTELLKLDNVDLNFTPDALKAIAKEAIEKETGARGLRSIMEDIMLDVMFSIPSMSNIKECRVTKNTVVKRVQPELILHETQGEAKPKKKTGKKTA